MSTYNTGNPVEPNGSTDPRDLYDNAQNFDLAINGVEKTWVDRKGVIRKTMTGYEENYTNVVNNLAPLGKVYSNLPSANAAIASGEIPTGTFFFIRSTSDSSIADEYQNVAGVATATGKSYPAAWLVNQLAITQLRMAQTGGYNIIGVIKDDNWNQPQISSYAVGFVSESHFVNYISVWLQNLENIDHFEVKVYSRSIDTPEVLPGSATDTVLWSGNIKASDVGQSSTYVTNFQLCKFEFPAIAVDTSLSTMIAITPRDQNGNAIFMGIGRRNNSTPASLTGSQRGYYINVGQTTWNAINSNQIAVQYGYELQTPRAAVEDINFNDIDAVFDRESNSTVWYGDTLGGNSDFYSWAIGFTGVSGKVNAISMTHANVLTNEKILLLLTLRTNANIASTTPVRWLANDVHLYTQVVAPSDVASSNDGTKVVYRFPDITIPSGSFLCAEVIGLTASGTPGHLGIGRHSYATTAEAPANAIERGFYRRGNMGATWAAVGVGLNAVAASIGVYDEETIKCTSSDLI